MLTVQDIQAQQFHVRFRGFDVEEVDEFLEQAAAALQAAEAENARLKEQLEAAERKVAAYKRHEQSAMSAIISAQKIAEEMKEKAANEAKGLLNRAREEAKGLEESAGREISDLEREVDRLRAMKSEVREELRLVLESYLSQLEGGEPVTGSRSLPAGSAAAAAAAGVAAAATPKPLSSDDDLYQRIELPAETESLENEAIEAAFPPDPASSKPSGSPRGADSIPTSPPTSAPTPTPAPTPAPTPPIEEETTLPDLDGDMVFTLEDPLDEEELPDSGPNIDLEDEDEPSAAKS